MRCADSQPLLPHLLYGHLSADQARDVDAHLASCPACQAELAGLKQVCVALDKLPTPAVNVDLSRIYAESQLQHERRLRRWRRLALGCAGLAAAVLLVLGLRMEVRMERHQLVLRWGNPPVMRVPVDRQSAPIAQPKSAPPEVTRADLELLRDLVHALADDVDGRDRQQQQSLAAVQKEFERLDREAQERWAATVRYVSSVARAETSAKGGTEP